MPRTTLDTPLGPLTLVSDGAALTAATFDPAHLGPEAEATDGGADGVLDAARAQLAAYFAGDAVAFDVPLALGGTSFQKRVWAALCTIPHGETLSYGALAARLGMPGGADGALVGYAGGLDRKRALLALESRQQTLF